VRERLRLAYGAAANGVAATITLPNAVHAVAAGALIALLAEVWPELEVAAGCEDGGAALEAIAARQPECARAGQGAPDPGALAELLRQLSSVAPAAPKAPPLVWLTASSGSDTLILVDDVAYFQSDTTYTVVMTAEGEALLRTPIRDLLAVLDPRPSSTRGRWPRSPATNPGAAWCGSGTGPGPCR
jgi:hypothetical protein